MTANLVSNVMLGSKQPVPVPGMGCTICMYTDRHPATIVEVKTFKSGARKGQVSAVLVQEDSYTRTDNNGMSDCQSYEFAPNPLNPIQEYRVNKAGSFVRDGSRLAIGYRDRYYDYSF